MKLVLRSANNSILAEVEVATDEMGSPLILAEITDNFFLREALDTMQPGDTLTLYPDLED